MVWVKISESAIHLAPSWGAARGRLIPFDVTLLSPSRWLS